MAGNKAGGKKTANTVYAKYGKDYYANIGRKGGLACVTKGFGANPELAKEAGRKGGKKSSRAGVKNGEGKTERRVSMPIYNRLHKIYVHHSKAKTEKILVKGA